MRVAQPVQFAIGGDHLFDDPRAVLSFSRLGAGTYHLLEGGVEAHLVESLV